MKELSESQKFIRAMTIQAIDAWAGGTENPLFPSDEHTSSSRANIIWNMALNSMAYGFIRGLSGLRVIGDARWWEDV